MIKKSIVATCILSACSTSLVALDLKGAISEVLDTNPSVQERLKNFQEVQQDLNIAKSGWLPSLDYRGTVGYVESGNIRDDVYNARPENKPISDTSYRQYTHSLALTQNIFNGFMTTNNISYQESRVLSASHNYVENANDIAFQMAEAYINVIRNYQLYQNAQDNVDIHEKIYEDVKSLYDAGLTTKSEMTKIFASLSLARSNLLVEQNNAREKELRFKRLLGREISVSSLTMPKLDIPLPESLERATAFAIENNPSIIVSNHNLDSSQALYKQKKGSFLPSVDLSVEQTYNGYFYDKGENLNGTTGDDLTSMLTLSWNLYRGGADLAELKKGRSTIAKDVEILRDLKRQLIEGLELSWTSYEMIGDQLAQLYEYQKYSQDTLESYISEYELGRRTLLDLLSAQQDLNNSKSEIVNAQLDKLFAQYRILDSMGLLVNTILGDEIKYNQVIDPTVNPFVEKVQELPIVLDVDKDGITDNLDICDNSLVGDNIKPYGCVDKIKDMDFDGVEDSLDICPKTKIGDIVDEQGCSASDSANRFEVDREAYITPIIAYNENSPIKSESSGLYDYKYSINPNENEASTEFDKHLLNDKFSLIKRFEPIAINEIDDNYIQKMANEIRKFEDKKISVTIIGYSTIKAQESEDDAKESYADGFKYAQEIKELLIAQGLSTDYLVVQSRMNKDSRYAPSNSLNNRVDVALYVPDVEPEKAEGIKLEEDEVLVRPLEGDEFHFNVIFDFDSSSFREESYKKLDNLKKYVLGNPQYHIVITGHASKDRENANAQYDRNLSLQRAERVKAYLISNGVAGDRLVTIGKGFDEPLFENTTPENRDKNRRVEVQLVERIK